MNKFNYIKSQLKLEDIVKKYTNLIVASDNYLKGKCPFKDCVDVHGDKFVELFKQIDPNYVKKEFNDDSQVFVVSPNKQIFYCFKCGKGGDIIALTSRMHDLSPDEAADKLCKEYKLNL